jgi:plasmid stability protein
MKKLVLRNLPPEIQLAIKRKALVEDLSREEAVVELLRDAELAEVTRRDLAIRSRRSSTTTSRSSRRGSVRPLLVAR